jgi:hypothetical protein
MNANDEAIAAVLANYQDALNQSDTDAVMKLYASDGVFTPQHSPSSVGAVRKAYDAVFDAITQTSISRSPTSARSPPTGFGREGQDQRDRRWRSGGQPGALRIPEDRRRLEDCALLLLHHQTTARIREKVSCSLWPNTWTPGSRADG